LKKFNLWSQSHPYLTELTLFTYPTHKSVVGAIMRLSVLVPLISFAAILFISPLPIPGEFYTALIFVAFLFIDASDGPGDAVEKLDITLVRKKDNQMSYEILNRSKSPLSIKQLASANRARNHVREIQEPSFRPHLPT